MKTVGHTSWLGGKGEGEGMWGVDGGEYNEDGRQEEKTGEIGEVENPHRRGAIGGEKKVEVDSV